MVFFVSDAERSRSVRGRRSTFLSCYFFPIRSIFMSYLFSQRITVMRPRLQFSLCPLCSRWQIFSPRKSSTVVKPCLHLIQFFSLLSAFSRCSRGCLFFWTLRRVYTERSRSAQRPGACSLFLRALSDHAPPQNFVRQPQYRHRTAEIFFQGDSNAAGE